MYSIMAAKPSIGMNRIFMHGVWFTIARLGERSCTAHVAGLGIFLAWQFLCGIYLLLLLFQGGSEEDSAHGIGFDK